MNTNPLPDLSGWHPLPDDATVPDDSPVAEVGKITRIIYVYPPPYRSQAPAERLGTPYDYFTPEPVASPPPLPTEPGTWIVADVRGGQEDLVLRLTENGDWIGVTDNRSMVSVPASYIEDWREVRWVPANEPEPVQVDFEPRDAHEIPGTSFEDLCTERSWGGWVCTRLVGHPDLHITMQADKVRAIWGEVS